MPLIKRVASELQKLSKADGLRVPVKNLLNECTQTLSRRNIQGKKLFGTNEIFTNNYLNLNKIGAIGFDLDYTLVAYTVELQELIYETARDILISSYGYPCALNRCEFDPRFAVRGLSVDVKRGILCKLSHMQRISQKRTYKGKQNLSAEQVSRMYGDSRHISHNNLSKMRPLHDLYCVPEACLIADMVDHFENNAWQAYDAEAVVEDVQAAIRDAHVSGAIQSVIVSKPELYIKRSPHLAQTLLHLRRSNKKLFLCTNSTFAYADKALRYVLGIDNMQRLSRPEELPFKDWRDLFDIVICSANKPEFYSSRKPFRRWNTENDRPDTAHISSLQRGEVYVKGSASVLRRMTGWSGHEILYIGDNLLNDLVEARRTHGWRTACIINELDEEIAIHNAERARELRFLRSSLRHLINEIQITCKSKKGSYDMGNEEHELLDKLESQLHFVNGEFSGLFNKHFGSIFRTDGHPSYFAFMLLRYVDLYMSDVTQFRSYSPNYRFYPHHALHMAHDPNPIMQH